MFQKLIDYTTSAYNIDNIFLPIVTPIVIYSMYVENGYSFCFSRTIAAQNCTIWIRHFEHILLSLFIPGDKKIIVKTLSKNKKIKIRGSTPT